jgi:hypothetical protein
MPLKLHIIYSEQQTEHSHVQAFIRFVSNHKKKTKFLDISTQICIGFKFHLRVDTVPLSPNSEYGIALKLCLRRGDKLLIVWVFRGNGWMEGKDWPATFYLLLPE